MPVLALLLAVLVGGLAPAQGETVLVKDNPLGSTGGETVLGWSRIPADAAPPGAITVPNAYLDLLADPASEPLAPQQWYLETIGLQAAWSTGTGSESVVVAVIDSGLEMAHPDLVERLFANPGEIPGNGVDDDGNGLVDDVTGWDVVEDDNDPTDPSVGHGTEVTGVAAASLNGIGIAGVAPGVTVLPIRACSSRCELFDVAWGIVYAVDLGADIINLSLGGFAEPGPLADAVDYAEAAGVLVVAAAGNSGADIDGANFVPATLPNPNLIAVAATTATDGLWPSSNRGSAAVDMAAPGQNIMSTTLETLGEYRSVSGTSFSTPQVAGTAALILSVRPGLAPPEVIQLLGRHGDPLGSLVATTVQGTRLRSDRAVAAARLTDIHASEFDRAIAWLAAADITRGCNPPTNNQFCPDRPVTRGEMAAFLHRALNLTPGPPVFTDTTNSEFTNSIAALAAAHITHGCNPPTNNQFCPDRPVTRGEMAAFLHRALNLTPGPPVFTDTTNSEFTNSIAALAAAHITHGCNPPTNNHFCPDRPVTRGEMAAFLHRALP